MKFTESIIQCNYIQWLKLQHREVASVTCAFANGGARTASYGARLKREGMQPGFPDVGVFYPFGGYHGLFIEFKSKKGKVTKLQEKALVNLAEKGYSCWVCYSLEDAIKVTRHYLLDPGRSSYAPITDLPSYPPA